MRHIQLAEAEAHFAQILDDVERGETVVITRQGKAVARLVPEEVSHQRRKDALAAMDELETLRKSLSGLKLEDILSAKHDGHRY